jgi:hypothetical protein
MLGGYGLFSEFQNRELFSGSREIISRSRDKGIRILLLSFG